MSAEDLMKALCAAAKNGDIEALLFLGMFSRWVRATGHVASQR